MSESIESIKLRIASTDKLIVYCQQVKDELEKAKKREDVLKESLKAALKEKQECQNSIASTSSALNESQISNIKDLQEKLSILNKSNKEAINDKEEQIKTLKLDVYRLKEEREKYDQMNQQLEDDMMEKEIQYNLVIDELSTLKDTETALNKEVLSYQTEIDTLKKELATATPKLNEAHDQLKQLRAAENESSAELASLKLELRTLRTEVSELRKRPTKAEVITLKKRPTEAEFITLKNELLSVKAENQKLRTRPILPNANSEIASLKKKVTDLSASIQDTNVKNYKYAKENERLNQYIAELKSSSSQQAGTLSPAFTEQLQFIKHHLDPLASTIDALLKQAPVIQNTPLVNDTNQPASSHTQKSPSVPTYTQETSSAVGAATIQPNATASIISPPVVSQAQPDFDPSPLQPAKNTSAANVSHAVPDDLTKSTPDLNRRRSSEGLTPRIAGPPPPVSLYIPKRRTSRSNTTDAKTTTTTTDLAKPTEDAPKRYSTDSKAVTTSQLKRSSAAKPLASSVPKVTAVPVAAAAAAKLPPPLPPPTTTSVPQVTPVPAAAAKPPPPLPPPTTTLPVTQEDPSLSISVDTASTVTSSDSSCVVPLAPPPASSSSVPVSSVPVSSVPVSSGPVSSVPVSSVPVSAPISALATNSKRKASEVAEVVADTAKKHKGHKSDLVTQIEESFKSRTMVDIRTIALNQPYLWQQVDDTLGNVRSQMAPNRSDTTAFGINEYKFNLSKCLEASEMALVWFFITLWHIDRGVYATVIQQFIFEMNACYKDQGAANIKYVRYFRLLAEVLHQEGNKKMMLDALCSIFKSRNDKYHLLPCLYNLDCVWPDFFTDPDFAYGYTMRALSAGCSALERSSPENVKKTFGKLKERLPWLKTPSKLDAYIEQVSETILGQTLVDGQENPNLYERLKDDVLSGATIAFAIKGSWAPMYDVFLRQRCWPLLEDKRKNLYVLELIGMLGGLGVARSPFVNDKPGVITILRILASVATGSCANDEERRVRDQARRSAHKIIDGTKRFHDIYELL